MSQGKLRSLPSYRGMRTPKKDQALNMPTSMLGMNTEMVGSAIFFVPLGYDLICF